jgi:hypothetical protein
MKILIAFLLVASAAVAVAADAPSVSGKWQIKASVAGTEADALCTFTQKENILTGSCATDAGTFDTEGKVDDKKVTFSYKTLYNGASLLVEYEGTWDPAGTMSGTINVPDYAVSGEFSGTLQK